LIINKIGRDYESNIISGYFTAEFRFSTVAVQARCKSDKLVSGGNTAADTIFQIQKSGFRKYPIAGL
jgi:hypothetical protein